MQSRELLEKLISFATVSRDSNLELIDFIQRYLSDLGITSKLAKRSSATATMLTTLTMRQPSPAKAPDRHGGSTAPSLPFMTRLSP